MKSQGKLPPIPTPLPHRVQRLRRSVLPALVCGVCLVAIVGLWRDRVGVTMIETGAASLATGAGPSRAAHRLEVDSRLEGAPLVTQPAAQQSRLELKLSGNSSFSAEWDRRPTELGDTNIISATD